MTIISPWWLVSGYFERGVRFTMGYPAVGLYMFDYISLIFWQVVVGVLAGGLSAYFGYLIRKQSLIRTVFAHKVYVSSVQALVMGELFQLFSYRTLLYAGIVVAIEICEWALGVKGRVRRKFIAR